MNKGIVIGLLICVLLVISYFVSKNPKWMNANYIKAKIVDSPLQIYSKSDGTFDEAAKLALERAKNRNSTDDHVLSATIITRNILSHEHKPEIDEKGNPTQSALDISQTRRTLFNDVKTHYINVLQDVNYQNMNIFNDILEFAFDGISLLIANDPLMLNFINLNDDLVDRNLLNMVNNRRIDIISERKEIAQKKALENGESKLGEISNYLEMSTQNTNDMQNSHDSCVLSCLKSIVDRLRIEQEDEKIISLDEIVEEIKKNGNVFSESRLYKVKDVLDVIDRIKLNEKVMSIGATDGECLSRVWFRSYHPNNKNVKDKILQSIFDSLFDCWEEGLIDRKIVCVNGRTSRILSSLILLDFDERNWEVKRLEQLKNDIYKKTSRLIEEEAVNATKSDNIFMQNAGKLYLAKSIEDYNNITEISDDVNEELANIIRNSIENMVRKTASGQVPDYILKTIIEEAKAAV